MAKKKIYLSPSDQYNNRYADGVHNEGEVCHRISGACEIYLKKYGFDVLRGKTGTYVERCKQANKYNPDLYICIHTNAGGGDGTLMMCWPGSENNAIIKKIYNAVAKISPGKDDGIKARTDLYEIKNSTALCAYLEIAFHDNAKEAQWLDEHSSEIGRAIAKAVADYYGYEIPDKDEGENVSRETLYKVQVGAFLKKSNAEKLAAELAKKGYNTYIIT